MTAQNRARTVNEIVEAGSEPASAFVRKDSERAVTIGPGLVIDPFNVRTWPEEQRRNHRLRRALHELIDDPRYRVEVGEKPDGTPGIRIVSPGEIPPEAQAFLVQYREEFITHLTWLELIDADSGIEGEIGLDQRKAA